MQDGISHRHRHLMFNFSLSSVPRRSLSRGGRWLARDAIEMKDSGLISLFSARFLAWRSAVEQSLEHLRCWKNKEYGVESVRDRRP